MSLHDRLGMNKVVPERELTIKGTDSSFRTLFGKKVINDMFLIGAFDKDLVAELDGYILHNVLKHKLSYGIKQKVYHEPDFKSTPITIKIDKESLIKLFDGKGEIIYDWACNNDRFIGIDNRIATEVQLKLYNRVPMSDRGTEPMNTDGLQAKFLNMKKS